MDKRKTKLYRICFISIVVLLAIVIIAALLQWWIVLIAAVLISCIPLYADDILHYRYDNFVRIGEYSDVPIEAEISFVQEHRFVDENIYLLKPSVSDLRKSGIHPQYYVAVTSAANESNRYRLRFIKPDDYQKLVKASTGFGLYDDNEQMASGHFCPN